MHAIKTLLFDTYIGLFLESPEIVPKTDTGWVGGTVDILTSHSSYNTELLATTSWSEPFLYYISECSVSISTVLFVAYIVVGASTASPKLVCLGGL